MNKSFKKVLQQKNLKLRRDVNLLPPPHPQINKMHQEPSMNLLPTPETRLKKIASSSSREREFLLT